MTDTITEGEKMIELARALNKAQGEMRGAVKESKNTFFKDAYGKPSSYADLASIFMALSEPFFKNGLSVSQPIEVREDGRMVLVTNIFHIGGGFLTSSMILPNIDNPQKVGAAITYYRRFSLQSLAGIPAVDDDGNDAAMAVAQANVVKPLDLLITKETENGIIEAVGGDKDLMAGILRLCTIKKLSQMKQSQVDGASDFAQKHWERINANT